MDPDFQLAQVNVARLRAPLDDPQIKDFVHSGPHLEYLKRRREWFAKLATPHLCLWWTRAGACPSPAEAKARLKLETGGAGAAAFIFARVYGPLDAT